MEENKVRKVITNLQMKWKYMAELAPWWGRFYERLIRSFRSTIRKTIGRRLRTEEQLRTIVVEAEGVLNNTALTYVYDDPNVPLPITPAEEIGARETSSRPHSRRNITRSFMEELPVKNSSVAGNIAAGIPSRIKKCKLEVVNRQPKQRLRKG
ncbi:hypothetical protein HPB48_011182 [Haemaphysalis longicornis]|uniref:Uncharacterized protein n=1 Tax=Haemaphysalis longicornis TaxID=44386 RepID=A0A9J6GTI6_HAELO|nr:hypothetical protein HPB48_011182 [Haemaphysalis longicornis]